MLIRLTSTKAGEMVMLTEHARPLFEIMHKECTARGVFTCEQLPEAVERLQQVIDEEKLMGNLAAKEARAVPHKKDEDARNNDEERPTPSIRFGQRATPLLRLMERTHKDGGFILWEAPEDF